MIYICTAWTLLCERESKTWNFYKIASFI